MVPFLGYGLGLRGKHHAHIMEHKPAIDWFEIISENYMYTDGAIKRRLEAIREHYPIVMHGVAMSIGTVDPLDSEYLRDLKKLIDWLQPAWVSDHLCWTGVAHKNSHDLLPVPYTEEALAHVVERIRMVQDMLEHPLMIENPSSYLEFKSSTMPESEFIARMAEEADCGLLLDVNNVYVSCYNHRWDVKTYLDALPLSRVAQVHLAGHSNQGTHIIDTHDDYVIPEVWSMYRYVISKSGPLNTMIEWDDAIPDFPVLAAELDKAKHAANTTHEYVLPDLARDFPSQIANNPPSLAVEQDVMQGAILQGAKSESHADAWIRPKPDFAPKDQLQVYVNAYRWRLEGVVASDFEVLRHYLGKEKTDMLIRDYVEDTPSIFRDAAKYPDGFPAFVAKQLPDDVIAQEIATLENAIVQLAPLPETEALTSEHFAAVTPEMLMDYVLKPRKALQLLQFTHPVNAYYVAVMQETELPLLEPQAFYLVVYRHEEKMWRLELEAQEYALLQLLFSGQTIGEALEAIQQSENFDEDALARDLQSWFSRWIRNGLLAYERLPVQMANR